MHKGIVLTNQQDRKLELERLKKKAIDDNLKGMNE